MSDFFEGIAMSNAAGMAQFTDAAAGGPQARADAAERNIKKEMRDAADAKRNELVLSRRKVGRTAAASNVAPSAEGAAAGAALGFAGTPFPFVTE